MEEGIGNGQTEDKKIDYEESLWQEPLTAQDESGSGEDVIRGRS